MPGSAGVYSADLTTDLIFDDAIYYTEALALPSNEDEGDVDSHLAIAAQLSGIEDPYSHLDPKTAAISTSMSMMSLQSARGSAVSIRSQDSQSTGITSQLSRRTSRDVALLPPQPTLARTSFSVDSAGYLSDRSDNIALRQRHSMSTFSVPSAIKDLPARRPDLRTKLKRGSALFARFRKDPSSSDSKSHEGPTSNNSHVRKLECRHTLSNNAVHRLVHDALGRKEKVASSCCGQILPKDLVHMVLTGEEVDVVVSSALTSPDVGSMRDSGYSEDGFSSIDIPRLDDAFANVPAIIYQEPSQMSEANISLVLASETFKSLKKEQREQFQRVASFESNQRKALAAHHQWSLRRLQAQLETRTAERIANHPLELERLEEFQLRAEHDLHMAHETETQNIATALKYMTAYCSGPNSTDAGLSHVVTDEDRNKLERQLLIQKKLPAKHESAINVLRAKQERDYKNKVLKQKKELEQLDANYARDKVTEELRYIKDSARLDALMLMRRRKIMNRWNLRFEIWRKDWENQHGTTLPGRLPHEDWPEITDDEDSAIPHWSELAIYAGLAC